MQAVIINQIGDSSVFKTVDMPKPTIKAGHVIIKVAASSVNPLDYKLRKGAFPINDFPVILHGDVAGTVVEVGEGVSQFKVGDEVYGCAGGIAGIPGALADYMLADAQLLAHKPTSLSLSQAAALPLAVITAWEAVIDRLKVTVGQSVLIHAATGGVGHLAIQLAKAAGAIVYATASTAEKMTIAKQLGADFVINYREQSVEEYVQKYTNGEGFDAVFDTIGGENIDKSIAAASVNGQVASIQTRSTHDLGTLQQKNLSFHAILMLIPLIYNRQREHHGFILKRVATLVDQGRLKPLIDAKQFTFNEVGLAHDYLESGKALGKIVLCRE